MVVPLLIDLANAEAHGPYVALMALNAIDHAGEAARPWLAEIEALPEEDPNTDDRPQYGIEALLEKITGRPG